MPEKILWNPKKNLVFVIFPTKRRYAHRESQN